MSPRSRCRAVAVTAALLVGSLAVAPATAFAQTGDTELERYTTLATPVLEADWVDPVETHGLNEEELVELPPFDFATLHDSPVFAAEIDWVEVDDDPLPAAMERHERTLQASATLQAEIEELRTELQTLRPQVDDRNRAIREEHLEIARLKTEIELYKEAIANFAIDAFIAEEELETALSVPGTELSETYVVVDELRTAQFEDIRSREADVVRRESRLVRLRSERQELRRRIRALRTSLTTRFEQKSDVDELAIGTAAGYQHLLHERLTLEVAGTDIQLVALNAYVIAERALAVEQPNCGIEWWMLAGIGKIESLHGQIFGDQLDINGTTENDIRGPALDGRILAGAENLEEGAEAPAATGRTEDLPVGDGAELGEDGEPIPVVKRLALITDTDDGRLDGDQTYDRAVGPMQFIPQTWRSYEVDADGDGLPNPQNIYDASIASARYLCNAAGSMTTPEGRELAYFAYNHDTEYTENVAAASEVYLDAIELPELEEGQAHELGVFATRDPYLEEIQRVVDELATLDLSNW